MGWCVLGHGRRGLRAGLVGSSSRSRLLFSKQSRKDTRKIRARAVQVAPVPAGKSASDAPACAPGTEEARPAPGRWFWIPDDDSLALDRGAAALMSGGAMGAQESGAAPSPGGAARASRPLFISRIEVNGVASVREGQVDIEPYQFHC